MATPVIMVTINALFNGNQYQYYLPVRSIGFNTTPLVTNQSSPSTVHQYCSPFRFPINGLATGAGAVQLGSSAFHRFRHSGWSLLTKLGLASGRLALPVTNCPRFHPG